MWLIKHSRTSESFHYLLCPAGVSLRLRTPVQTNCVLFANLFDKAGSAGGHLISGVNLALLCDKVCVLIFNGLQSGRTR